MSNRLTTVTEPQVLLATFDWLLNREVFPYRISISGGKKPEEREEQETLKREIMERYKRASKKVGKDILPDFLSSGPDIEAISSSEWWRIECKGSGKGKSSTQENKFFLGLGKTVSYWTDELLPNWKDALLFLGYALPDTDIYVKHLQQRVRKPLRQRLNLWILLFEMETDKIRPISPEEEIQ